MGPGAQVPHNEQAELAGSSGLFSKSWDCMSRMSVGGPVPAP